MNGKPTYEDLEKRIGSLEQEISGYRKVQEELREANRLLEAVLDGVQDIIGIQKPDHTIVRYNLAGYRMLGLDQGAVEGKPCYSLIGRNRPCPVCATKHALTSRKIESVDVYFRELDRHFLCRSNPVLDAQGNVQFIVEQLHDLTKQKESETALRKSEEKYRTLLENLNEVVFALNDKAVITFVSSSIERIGGHKPEELTGRGYIDFVHPDDRQGCIEQFQEILAGVDEPSEYRLLKKDGTPLWVRTNARAIFDDNHQAEIHGTLFDITERKLTEEKLSHTQQQLMTVMDSMDAFVYIADMKTHELLFVNEYGRKAWGNVEGHLCWKALQKRQEGPCPFCTNDRILGSDGLPGGVYEWEFQNTLNGRWYDCRDKAIRWPDGRTVRMEIATDITERKHLENSLRKRLVYEQMLSRISSLAFIAEDLPGFLHESIAIMGQTMSVSRAYLFEHRDEINAMDNTHEWCAEGVTPQGHRLQGLSGDMFPWWMAMLRSGQNLVFSNIEDIPDEQARQTLRQQNILSVLVVPLFVGGRYYGFLGFDECRYHREWPQEDVEILLAIARILSVIVDRKGAEMALREGEAFQRILLNLATGFINPPLEQFDAAINEMLAKIGRFTKLDRAYVFRHDHLRHVTSNTHEWCNEGIKPQIANLQETPFEFFADMIAIWQKGEIVHIPSVAAMPEKHAMKTILSNQGIQSLVLIPLFDGEVNCGFVGFDAVKKEKVFTEKEIALLAVLAEIIENVLAREKAEETLRESEELYRNLFAHHAAVKLIIDPETGSIVDANESAVRYYGWPPEMLRQMKIQDINTLAPGDVEKEMHKAVNEKRTHFEFRHRLADGSIRDVEVFSSRINIRGKNLLHSIIHDITDRNQAERDRKDLQERLQRAEKMETIGLLAGGVAHDLNNVLGIVVGYSELLLFKMDETSGIRREVRKIMDGGERAAAIVQDLLTLARRGVQNRTIVNLNTEIIKCQQTPEFQKLRSFHPNVRITTNLEVDLLNVKGSPVYLGKVFYNLLSNALEAMPEGGTVSVSTRNVYLDRPVLGYDKIREGDYIVLSISDTGEGISAVDIKRVFEPFYTKKVMGRSGTGLGLAVVWGTVKDHNGYINVTSEEGKGSNFSLYFPVTREEIAVDTASVPVKEYTGHAESILVVDDVAGQRELAVQMLQRLQYDVTGVSSGEEACEYLKTHKVDLLVLDMIMDPGMDGLESYRKILEIHPKQKAVIVSGFAETARVAAAQALGAGSYVKKPYVMEKLGLAIRNELEKL